jgi:hypothetical protein
MKGTFPLMTVLDAVAWCISPSFWREATVFAQAPRELFASAVPI